MESHVVNLPDEFGVLEPEPKLTRERIFQQKEKPPGLCGKPYLHRYHKDPVADYNHLLRQIRTLFMNARNPRVDSLLFCNYRCNATARDDCKQFIAQHIDSLLGLTLFHKDGRSEVFKFVTDDLFEYFLIHKPYYITMFKNKKKALQLDENLLEEHQRIERALLEALPVSEEVDAIEAVTRHEAEADVQVRSSTKKAKKKHKNKSSSFDIDFWRDLTYDDKVTICHRLVGIKSRKAVTKGTRAWMQQHQDTSQSVPKLKNVKTDEAYIEIVAKWALSSGFIAFVGQRGSTEGYALADWKRIL
jgi:hypothetical protein